MEKKVDIVGMSQSMDTICGFFLVVTILLLVMGVSLSLRWHKAQGGSEAVDREVRLGMIEEKRESVSHFTKTALNSRRIVVGGSKAG